MNRNSKISLIILLIFSISLYSQNFNREISENTEQFALRCRPNLTDTLCSKVIETDLWNQKAKILIVFYSTIESKKAEEKRDHYSVNGYVFIPIGNNSYHRIYIDEYGQEGGDAEIESVFFANADKDKNKEMVILCSWEQRHYQISGKLYQTYFYDDIDFLKPPKKLKLLENLNKIFKTEFDGVNEEGKSSAKFKSANKIRGKLKQLGF